MKSARFVIARSQQGCNAMRGNLSYTLADVIDPANGSDRDETQFLKNTHTAYSSRRVYKV